MSGPCWAYYTQLLKVYWLLSLHSMNNEHGERASAWFSMKELDFHNLMFLPRIVKLFPANLLFLLVVLTIIFVARLIAITKSIPMLPNDGISSVLLGDYTSCPHHGSFTGKKGHLLKAIDGAPWCYKWIGIVDSSFILTILPDLLQYLDRYLY